MGQDGRNNKHGECWEGRISHTWNRIWPGCFGFGKFDFFFAASAFTPINKADTNTEENKILPKFTEVAPVYLFLSKHLKTASNITYPFIFIVFSRSFVLFYHIINFYSRNKNKKLRYKPEFDFGASEKTWTSKGISHSDLNTARLPISPRSQRWLYYNKKFLFCKYLYKIF